MLSINGERGLRLFNLFLSFCFFSLFFLLLATRQSIQRVSTSWEFNAVPLRAASKGWRTQRWVQTACQHIYQQLRTLWKINVLLARQIAVIPPFRPDKFVPLIFPEDSALRFSQFFFIFSLRRKSARLTCCCWWCTGETSWTRQAGTLAQRAATWPRSPPCWRRWPGSTSRRPASTWWSSWCRVPPCAPRPSPWCPSECSWNAGWR